MLYAVRGQLIEIPQSRYSEYNTKVNAITETNKSEDTIIVLTLSKICELYL